MGDRTSSELEAVLRSLPGRLRPEKTAGTRLLINLRFSGITPHTYQVIIAEGRCEVKTGAAEEPNAELHTDPETYLLLEKGQLNPQKALMSGKLKVSNPAVMMGFSSLFHPYRPAEETTSTDSLPEVKARPRIPGPLQGIRLLDLSRLLPGPLAAMMMADMGAEVIKIENPQHPDYIRNFPPYIDDISLNYLLTNRNKHSLGLNLRKEKGRTIFFELLKTADVVLESFRPGVLASYGIDYEEARKVNPSIIYVSLTGYGQTGPYAAHAGHDLNYVGYAGILDMTGDESDPVMPGVQIADISGGSYMAIIGTLSALWERAQSGQGQQVDAAMLDGSMPLMSLLAGYGLNQAMPLKRGQMPLSGGLANYNVYRCKDGRHIALGSLEPKFWEAFCTLAGREDWKNEIMPDPRKHKELKAELSDFFLSKTRDEWLKFAETHDFCFSPVLQVDELAHDPHIRERKMIRTEEHPQAGPFRSIGTPIKFSRYPNSDTASWAAPELGEDSIRILRELGYEEEAIRQLIREGILGIASSKTA